MSNHSVFAYYDFPRQYIWCKTSFAVIFDEKNLYENKCSIPKLAHHNFLINQNNPRNHIKNPQRKITCFDLEKVSSRCPALLTNGLVTICTCMYSICVHVHAIWKNNIFKSLSENVGKNSCTEISFGNWCVLRRNFFFWGTI